MDDINVGQLLAFLLLWLFCTFVIGKYITYKSNKYIISFNNAILGFIIAFIVFIIIRIFAK